MVVLHMDGGIGNQMFLYAFYLSLRRRNRDVKINGYHTITLHNGPELERVFGARIEYATKRDLARLGFGRYSLYNLIRNRIFGKKARVVRYCGFDLLRFMPEVYDLDDVYLMGHWESEKYFKDIEDEVRSVFAFKAFEDDRNAALAERIREVESVSIHVRRGDYVGNPGVRECSATYYANALARIGATVEKPHFFIFSDDIDWCRKNLSLEGRPATCVDWNKKQESYRDMQLMSLCRHHVIPNSTFSWWGAWLNRNPGKVVVAPSEWTTFGSGTGDLVPENWTKVGL